MLPEEREANNENPIGLVEILFKREGKDEDSSSGKTFSDLDSDDFSDEYDSESDDS